MKVVLWSKQLYISANSSYLKVAQCYLTLTNDRKMSLLFSEIIVCILDVLMRGDSVVTDNFILP